MLYIVCKYVHVSFTILLFHRYFEYLAATSHAQDSMPQNNSIANPYQQQYHQ